MRGPGCLRYTAACLCKSSRRVRPSGLFFGGVSSLHALSLLGVQPTWLQGGQNQSELSSARGHGRCPHPPCVLQQATYDSRHLGSALLGTSQRSTYVLPGAFLPRLFPQSWAVSLAAV